MSDFRQTSTGDEVFLDHLAHWIPDMDAASEAFERLGFLLTPYTEHTNSTAPGEPILPAGSANRCIMLREGYLEVLTPTVDTAIGQELRAGIDRYVGLHLIAFGCSDAEAQRERLIGEGFEQRPHSYAPDYDHTGTTAILAAQVLLNFIGRILHNRR